MNTASPPTRESEVSALKRAIQVERRARFADFQGRRSTFSQFMRQTADRLCRRYPIDSRWATIRGLFRQYANLDVATRISIVRRVEELLDQLNQCAHPVGLADDDKDKLFKAAEQPRAQTGPGKAESQGASGLHRQAAQPASATQPAKVQPPDQRLYQSAEQVDVKFVRGVGRRWLSSWSIWAFARWRTC